jgi:hypothetical protein
VRFRQASPPADDGDVHEGSTQKKSHGPSLRPHHPPNPTVVDALVLPRLVWLRPNLSTTLALIKGPAHACVVTRSR